MFSRFFFLSILMISVALVFGVANAEDEKLEVQQSAEQPAVPESEEAEAAKEKS